MFLLIQNNKAMKIFPLLFIFFSCFFSAQIKYPEYIISDKNISEQKLETTEDIYFFYHKNIQYIGDLKSPIELNYNNYPKENPILKNNYKRPDDELHKQFKNEYKNVKIVVDIRQSTPLTITRTDTTKISPEVLEAEIDRLIEGKEPTIKIPTITTYYDGYPVTIHNLEDQDIMLGFGNHIPLIFEALDKENNWQEISGIRKYSCGNGIQYIMLKPNQIATVFEPKIKGNFKTKFRYRLKNMISNEFEGSINEDYFKTNP